MKGVIKRIVWREEEEGIEMVVKGEIEDMI